MTSKADLIRDIVHGEIQKGGSRDQFVDAVATRVADLYNEPADASTAADTEPSTVDSTHATLVGGNGNADLDGEHDSE